MSYSLRSNSETSTCKDYRAFADVKLPRPERVQANDKLCKVELLQRAGHRVKVYLASDVPLPPVSHGVCCTNIAATPQTEVL